MSFQMQAAGNDIDHPIKLSKAEFIEKVMDYEKNQTVWKYEGELPCIIDFYADWCKPCRMAAPILSELAKEYAGKIIVYKVDTQVEKELASVFGISSIPAFLWVPMSGKPTMSNGIASTDAETKKMFEEMIKDVLLKK
jgi:thioredoxin